MVAMLDPQPGETLLDACAAPGGKALFSAARMQVGGDGAALGGRAARCYCGAWVGVEASTGIDSGDAHQLPPVSSPHCLQGRGRILALDVGSSRLAALRNMAGRQQHGGMVRTWAADLRTFAAERRAEREAAAAAAAGGAGSAEAALEQEGQPPLPTLYDRVLLDAPCSGTGVLAKRADLRWRKQAADVQRMAALQAELLDAAAGAWALGPPVFRRRQDCRRAEVVHQGLLLLLHARTMPDTRRAAPVCRPGAPRRPAGLLHLQPGGS